jgi:tetratricopeptide (TPR) repeat protein
MEFHVMQKRLLRLAPALALSLPLMVALAPAPAHAQAMPGIGGRGPNDDLTTLDQPAPEGGWDALARLLDKGKPSTDTRLTPTPSQYTDRIELLLNQGKNQQALDLINKRLAQTDDRPAYMGTDVQLEFQHARALAALGQIDQAQGIYSEMTVRYPELPEPWNNLGVLYVKRGDIDQAQTMFQNAVRADPNYATAKANLADVQLMIAKRSYSEAAKAGDSGSQSKARALDNVLKTKPTE